MSAIDRLRDGWRRNRLLRSIGITRERKPNGQAGPPVIDTAWGAVTESARRQAALNMRASDDLREQVEILLGKQLGDAELGIAESRRRYREAYPDLDGTY